MQKITPSLWFDNNCEEAMNYYVSIFPNSRIISIRHYPEQATDEHLKGMEGKVLHGEFELNGQQFVALDGGPVFKFNEAISFMIDCADQAEVDYYWERLSAVPEAEQCGWVKDKFGVSWQIVPRRLGELMNDPDEARAGRAMEALMQMKKIDIEGLERAAAGE
jgi:predicted 3-demethylubiquinone-9 3-methyltransferase (glyoxalase superfamily)